MTAIDHLILKVNDLAESRAFYRSIMGFQDEGEQGPFVVMRVSDEFQIQLAPWKTEGYEHFAFSVSRDDFDLIFQKIREQGIDYGPSFHDVGSNEGPGVEAGARGDAPTLYFYDPNKHLLEIRAYES